MDGQPNLFIQEEAAVAVWCIRSSELKELHCMLHMGVDRTVYLIIFEIDIFFDIETILTLNWIV